MSERDRNRRGEGESRVRIDKLQGVLYQLPCSLKKKIDASIYFKMFHYSFISNKDMEVNNLVAYTVSNTEYTIP